MRSLEAEKIVNLFKNLEVIGWYDLEAKIIKLLLPKRDISIWSLEKALEDIGFPAKVQSVAIEYDRLVVTLRWE